MKRILMVGAGSCQLNAIKKIKEMGHYVIAADYNDWTEGKGIADAHVKADAFDVDEISKAAMALNIDGLLTVGTDQPVYTVNSVAEKLGLPHFLDIETALRVTNKKEMKHRFTQFRIPTVPYVIIRQTFSALSLVGLKPPYVIKPIDSQGQRGIFKVDTIDEIRQMFEQVLTYSRKDEILVESFYESDEITVSGWVHKSKPRILTITDRLTFPPDERIGVCYAHQHPSKFTDSLKYKIETLVVDICRAFDIHEGPFYFQFLVGDKGILVNEIACRIGGAYEDVTIPYVTQFDILEANINGAINEAIFEFHSKVAYDIVGEDKYFSTQLFFYKPGRISYQVPMETLKKHPFILDARFNFNVGDLIGNIENASQRAGYMIVTGKSKNELSRHLDMAFEALEVLDENGLSMVKVPHQTEMLRS